MPDSAAPLKEFFERDVAQRATKPLRDGIEIAIECRDGSPPAVLVKKGGRLAVEARAAAKPDMTFSIGPKTAAALLAETTQDIGEIGIAIVKLMAHESEDSKIRAKVHIGLFDLLRNGYLSIVPLGGATFMKYLASKGVTGVGKIKERISHLRE